METRPLVVTDHSLSGVVTDANTGEEICVSLEGSRMSKEAAKKILTQKWWMYVTGLVVGLSCIMFFNYLMIGIMCIIPCGLGLMKVNKLSKVVAVKLI